MLKGFIKHNKKGFSLVELIVAVAILAVAAAPLMHSFVVSAQMNNKSTRVNNATLAAQNLQELITASSAADALNGSCFDNAVKVPKMTNTLLVRDVSSGNENFDALVSFSADEYKDVNDVAVPAFSAIHAIYSQPTTDKANPDALAYNTFGSDAISKVQRTITLQIDRGEDGRVYASVEYRYVYGSTLPQVYEYDLLPNGFEQTGSEPVNIYLMYFPWTYYEGLREDVVIQNTDDVETKVFLVRQKLEGDDNGVTASNIGLYVRQNQSSSYNFSNPTSFLYCNTKYNQGEGSSDKNSLKEYRVYRGSIWYRDALDSVTYDVMAVKSSPRLYAVNISLYKAGELVSPTLIEASNLPDSIYTLTASKHG